MLERMPSSTQPTRESGLRIRVAPEAVEIVDWPLVQRPLSSAAALLVAGAASGLAGYAAQSGTVAAVVAMLLCLTCPEKIPDAPLGVRLKAFRVAAGLNKKSLATRAAVGVAILSPWERRRREPLWPRAVRLVRVPGLGLGTLGIEDGEG